MTVLASQDIPSNLLARYVTGQATAKEIAARLRISPATASKRLQAMGVDTTKGRYKTRQLAFGIERDHQRPMGTAAATVATLYRSGLSTYEVAARLGCARQRAWRLLQRHGVTLRPRWYREVFRTTDGRPRSMRRFSAKVLEMRRERRWSQDYVADFVA